MIGGDLCALKHLQPQRSCQSVEILETLDLMCPSLHNFKPKHSGAVCGGNKKIVGHYSLGRRVLSTTIEIILETQELSSQDQTAP